MSHSLRYTSLSAVEEALVNVALSWPVQTVPLVLLLRLTVYEGAAGVRVESAGGVVPPEVSRAMSSRTKLVWRLESSVPVKARLTSRPERRHVERLLYVTGGLVEVRVRRQCRTADLRGRLSYAVDEVVSAVSMCSQKVSVALLHPDGIVTLCERV